MYLIIYDNILWSIKLNAIYVLKLESFVQRSVIVDDEHQHQIYHIVDSSLHGGHHSLANMWAMLVFKGPIHIETYAQGPPHCIPMPWLQIKRISCYYSFSPRQIIHSKLHALKMKTISYLVLEPSSSTGSDSWIPQGSRIYGLRLLVLQNLKGKRIFHPTRLWGAQFLNLILTGRLLCWSHDKQNVQRELETYKYHDGPRQESGHLNSPR